MLSKHEATVVLQEIAATWPQRQMDEPQVAVWLETLATVATVDLARAARRRLKESLDWPPTHHEFLVAVEEEKRRQVAERALHRGAPQACRECNDDIYVTLTGSTSKHVPIVRPCSRCRPLEYMRWAGGHFASGHHCGDCRDLIKGSTQQRAEARERIMQGYVPVDLEPAF